MQSFPLPSSLIPPGPKYFSQPHILEHTKHMILPQCDRSSFTLKIKIKKTGTFTFPYILIFIFLGSELDDKGF
jgi:hypothetical protein